MSAPVSVGASGGLLVDGIDRVDAAVLGEQVFHADLALVLRTIGDGRTSNRRVTFGEPEALQIAIAAERIDRAARRSVQHRQHRLLVGERLAGIGALLHAGLEIIGGERRVDGVGRIGCRIQRNHEHPCGARFLDDAQHAGRVVRRHQYAFGAGADQIFDRSDLAFVVAVELARAGDQLDTLGLGRLF